MVKKQLRINWILPRANLSGGIKVVRELAEAISARGHRSVVSFLDPRTEWSRPWRIRALGKAVVRELRFLGKERHHLQRSAVPLIEVHGSRIEPQHVPDADVAIATWWETMEQLQHWPSSKGRPVYYIQGYDIHNHIGNTQRIQATYRYPVLKIVVSRWLQDLMAEEYGDRHCILVPNGLNYAQYDSSPRRRADVPTVGTLYSPSRSKQVDVAFRAIKIVQRVEPALRVICFGAEPIPSAQLVPANLKFFLRPRQHQIPHLHRSCDCWIIASSVEGFGLPGLEAAACRCPIVATRCGGPEDYISDGESGYLVDVGDTEQMAHQILRVIRQPEQMWMGMSEASYAIARTFDWDQSAEQLEKALLSYLSR